MHTCTHAHPRRHLDGPAVEDVQGRAEAAGEGQALLTGPHPPGAPRVGDGGGRQSGRAPLGMESY